MAVLAGDEGSATIGTTEWSLTANAAGPSLSTTVGVYELRIAVSAMEAGDRYLIQAYEKVRASASATRYLQVTLSGVQPDAQYVIFLGALMYGWDVTMKKLAGTDRSFEWSFRRAP